MINCILLAVVTAGPNGVIVKTSSTKYIMKNTTAYVWQCPPNTVNTMDDVNKLTSQHEHIKNLYIAMSGNNQIK